MGKEHSSCRPIHGRGEGIQTPQQQGHKQPCQWEASGWWREGLLAENDPITTQGAHLTPIRYSVYVRAVSYT